MGFFEQYKTDGLFYNFNINIKNHDLYKLHQFEKVFMDADMMIDFLILELQIFNEHFFSCNYNKGICILGTKYDGITSNDRFLDNLLTIEKIIQPFILYSKSENKHEFWCSKCFRGRFNLYNEAQRLDCMLVKICNKLVGCNCLLGIYPTFNIDGVRIRDENLNLLIL